MLGVVGGARSRTANCLHLRVPLRPESLLSEGDQFLSDEFNSSFEHMCMLDRRLDCDRVARREIGSGSHVVGPILHKLAIDFQRVDRPGTFIYNEVGWGQVTHHYPDLGIAVPFTFDAAFKARQIERCDGRDTEGEGQFGDRRRPAKTPQELLGFMPQRSEPFELNLAFVVNFSANREARAVDSL